MRSKQRTGIPWQASLLGCPPTAATIFQVRSCALPVKRRTTVPLMYMILSVLCLLTLGTTASARRAADSYEFVTLDVPGEASGINNHDQIVGFFTDSSFTTHGYLFAEGTVTVIDIPGATATFAAAINNRGQIVGDFDLHGFLIDGGEFLTLDVPGSAATRAQGINTRGQVVGAYHVDGEKGEIFHGFLSDREVFTAIDVPGADPQTTRIEAWGINNRRQIVGHYFVDFFASGSMPHGFLVQGDQFRTLEIPGASGTQARGINDQGQIVGFYTDQNLTTHGFLTDGQTFTTIDVPGALFTEVRGINNRGHLVGVYYDGRGGHSFLATKSAKE